MYQFPFGHLRQISRSLREIPGQGYGLDQHSTTSFVPTHATTRYALPLAQLFSFMLPTTARAGSKNSMKA